MSAPAQTDLKKPKEESKTADAPEPTSFLLDNNENQLISLLYWKNPIQSFMVLLSIEIFCYLVGMQNYSVVTLLSFLVMVQLLVCVFYVNGTKAWLAFQGKPIPSDQFYSPNEDIISPQELDSLLRPTVNTLNWIIKHAVDLFRCVDGWNTILALFTALFFALLGKVLSGIALLALMTFVLFVCPVLVHNNQRKVDALLAKVVNKLGKGASSAPTLARPKVD